MNTSSMHREVFGCGEPPVRAAAPHQGRRGSVLIMVLWVAFGLVSLALYFAHSMSMEARAADHRCGSIQAMAAIQGAANYITNLLADTNNLGNMPDPLKFHCEGIPVGEARYWIIGRSDRQTALDRPSFGLVDECSKLDLNTATVTMLTNLPRVTAELAAAIIDWRDTNSDVTTGGAEDDTYVRLTPPYNCKNAPFETVEELHLVYGMTMEILFGEDVNLNGTLDANEDDGDETAPSDTRDGRLDPGLMEYLTVYTRRPTVRADGTALVDVNGGRTNLQALIVEKLGSDKWQTVARALGNAQSFSNVLHFYAQSQMTADDFAQIEGDLTASTLSAGGPVNVNTAPEAVLASIPGIGVDKASSLIARRQSNPLNHSSMAWVTEILETADIIQAGNYITGKTYQFSLDIAAVGRFGRGWQRVRYVVDTAEAVPKFIARRDLSSLGWALGKEARAQLLSANTARR